jgi:transcriptional regulator with XRE-family HTH domain
VCRIFTYADWTDNFFECGRFAKNSGSALRNCAGGAAFLQQDLAHECWFDKSYLRAVECGEKNITFARIYRIARALRVSLFELFKAM